MGWWGTIVGGAHVYSQPTPGCFSDKVASPVQSSLPPVTGESLCLFTLQIISSLHLLTVDSCHPATSLPYWSTNMLVPWAIWPLSGILVPQAPWFQSWPASRLVSRAILHGYPVPAYHLLLTLQMTLLLHLLNTMMSSHCLTPLLTNQHAGSLSHLTLVWCARSSSILTPVLTSQWVSFQSRSAWLACGCLLVSQKKGLLHLQTS